MLGVDVCFTKFQKSYQFTLQIAFWLLLLAISTTGRRHCPAGCSFCADNTDSVGNVKVGITWFNANITWYTFRVDQKGDPADDNKEAGGEIVGDHIEGHLSGQNKFKTSNAVENI